MSRTPFDTTRLDEETERIANEIGGSCSASDVRAILLGLRGQRTDGCIRQGGASVMGPREKKLRRNESSCDFHENIQVARLADALEKACTLFETMLILCEVEAKRELPQAHDEIARLRAVLAEADRA
jgi:hypothetical protein